MLLILLKSTIIWLVWILCYHLVLKYNTYYIGRRIFLYVGLISGLLLPWLVTPLGGLDFNTSTPVIFIEELTNGNGIQEGNAVSKPIANINNWLGVIVWSVYILGVVIMFFRTFRELIFLRKIIKRHDAQQLIFSEQVASPISFLSFTIIPKENNFSKQELEMILHHESIHIQKKHFIDVLLMQFLQILLWFHPLIWIYKKYFMLIHENEADEFASQVAPYEYGQLLLKVGTQKNRLKMTHSFNYSPLKNRIFMLTKNRKQTSTLGYLLALPLLMLSLMAMKPKSDKKVYYNLSKTPLEMKIGNDKITWSEKASGPDTIYVIDPETEQEVVTIMNRENEQIALKYNNKQTVLYQFLLNKDYDYDDELIFQLKKHVLAQINKTPQNFNALSINNMVVDEKKQIKYFDVVFYKDQSRIDKISKGEMKKLQVSIAQFFEKNNQLKVKSEHAGEPLYIEDFCTIKF